jgi:hypothetical protein
MIRIIDYTHERSQKLFPPSDLEKEISSYSQVFRAAIIRSEVRGTELHIWMDPKICECELCVDMPIYIWVMRLLLVSWSSEMHKVTQIVGHVRDCGMGYPIAKLVANPLDYVGKHEGGDHMKCHMVFDILGLLTWVGE